MPDGASGKPVSGGGWLAPMSADLVYAAKGNKTDEFYRYDWLAYPEWRSVSPIPLGPSGKLPRKGCRGASDGERYIYMAKGGNTCEFWRYDVVADTWTQLPDVPEQPSGKRVRSGTGMVCTRLRDASNVCLLKGNARDFLRFNTLAGRWEVLPSAPVVTGSHYDEGSWLVYDDSQYIYCHRAKLHEFWKVGMHLTQVGLAVTILYARQRGLSEESNGV
jgi:hypothetical protein